MEQGVSFAVLMMVAESHWEKETESIAFVRDQWNEKIAVEDSEELTKVPCKRVN